MALRTEKIPAAIVVSALGAIAIHFDYIRRHAAGRDAYMASQAVFFDKYIAHPQWLGTDVAGLAIIFMFALCIYEGFAHLFGTMWRKLAVARQQGEQV